MRLRSCRPLYRVPVSQELLLSEENVCSLVEGCRRRFRFSATGAFPSDLVLHLGRSSCSAEFLPQVSVLDYYCTASSERPAGIAHEAFCTLFDLSEDRFTCILPRSPAVSSVGDAASTRRRMQSVLPLVLRRCRGILQRFATSSMSSPTSASSASVNSSVNSLGSLPCSGAEAHRSAGRLPSGDRGASSSYPPRSPQLGRFQLLLFVLSRLRSLRTSPLAFEEDQEKDDEFQALEESAGPDSGDCLQGDARGLQAVRPQQRRAAALRASGEKKSASGLEEFGEFTGRERSRSRNAKERETTAKETDREKFLARRFFALFSAPRSGSFFSAFFQSGGLSLAARNSESETRFHSE
ncbi:hypothetical protein TGP89_360570 [Toxoplasma gondii p89]|uniref:Uncharacterized protein n=1 Tax=Toxoplasma gondii p89 TaxID=943119 RepID=A0A086JN90_TOXGO|nr:hypothetical protein TGP89_360570 [Toxoplasma gondii p89]